MTETPRLLLDRTRLERNAARLRERCSTLGVDFRPHLKTAKCAEVARLAHGDLARLADLAEAEHGAAVYAAERLRARGHASPVVSAGSTPTLASLEGRMTLALRQVAARPEHRECAVAEHLRVVAAIEAHGGREAETAMRAHIAATRRRAT